MFLFSNKVISLFGSISLWNENNVRSNLNPDFDKSTSPGTDNNRRCMSRQHAADSPSMSSLFLLLLLLVNLCTNGVAVTPAKPTFSYVQQNNNGQLIATIEGDMHCDSSSCGTDGACCTHTVSCGCGCVTGWTGTRCDQPSSTEWAAQNFHYNITFKHKIPIRKWTADDLSNSGYKIDVGASYRQDHQDAFNTINDPSFRVRVMIEVDSMTQYTDICATYSETSIVGGSTNFSQALACVSKSWFPFLIGKGGGVDFHGRHKGGISVELRNDPFSYSPRPQSSFFNYNGKLTQISYSWVTKPTKNTKVLIGNCLGQGNNEIVETCGILRVGAQLYIVDNGDTPINGRVVGLARQNTQYTSTIQGHDITINGASATVAGTSTCDATGADATATWETRSVNVYECVGGYLDLHVKTEFVFDSVQLSLNGTRRIQMYVGQHGVLTDLGFHHVDENTGDLYKPVDFVASIVFGTTNEFDGTLYEMEIDTLPTVYLTLKDSNDSGEYVFAPPFASLSSPTEMYVAACNSDGCSPYTASGISTDIFCTAAQTKETSCPACQKVSEMRGEATSKQIMSALVTGGTSVAAPSLGSCKLTIVIPDHEERNSSKGSVTNDLASTSAAAARKVRKVLETWQRRGWVILKRLTLLLVLTVLTIAMLAVRFLPLYIVSISMVHSVALVVVVTASVVFLRREQLVGIEALRKFRLSCFLKMKMKASECHETILSGWRWSSQEKERTCARQALPTSSLLPMVLFVALVVVPASSANQKQKENLNHVKVSGREFGFPLLVLIIV